MLEDKKSLRGIFHLSLKKESVPLTFPHISWLFKGAQTTPPARSQEELHFYLQQCWSHNPASLYVHHWALWKLLNPCHFVFGAYKQDNNRGASPCQQSYLLLWNSRHKWGGMHATVHHAFIHCFFMFIDFRAVFMWCVFTHLFSTSDSPSEKHRMIYDNIVLATE